MGGWVPISPWRLGLAQDVTTSGTSASTATVAGSEIRAVLVSTTADCYIRIGQPTQTAVTTDTLIKAAYPPLVFGCIPGDVVAAIQVSAGGTLSVTHLTH